MSIYQVCSDLNIFLYYCIAMLFSIQSSFLSMFATFNIPMIQTMQLTLQMRKLRLEDNSSNVLKGTWKSWQN